MCACLHATRVFFHVFVVQSYKHMNLHAFSRIVCVFHGQHMRGTRISHLSLAGVYHTYCTLHCSYYW